MSQKSPEGNFKWVEGKSQFRKDFIENYNKDSDKGSFLDISVQYPEKLHDLHNGLPFLPATMTVEKLEKLVVK